MKRFLQTLAVFALLVTPAFAGETAAAAAASPELRWRRTVIPVSFSQSLLKNVNAVRPDSDVAGAVRRSLDAWEAVAGVRFVVSWTDRAAISPAGKAGDGVNLVTIAPASENMLAFGGDGADASAKTRIFFNRRGEIGEADIVLNPFQQFSTDGSFGTFDLESTLTHELGHLLGLDHSPVAGATMSDVQARNGVFMLPGFAMRTLSEDDVAKARAIYGAAAADDECCGGVEGRLSFSGRAVKSADVWLETTDGGQVVTGARLSSDGVFALRGIDEGRYRLIVQDNGGTAADLGVVEVSKGKSAVVTRRVAASARLFDIDSTGLNGQLSRVAVPVAAGRATTLYLGGRGLDPAKIEIFSGSAFIEIGSAASRADFGRDIDVVTVEVRVSPDAPAGDYTIGARDAAGRVVYLAGRLTVEKFAASATPPAFD